MSHFYGKLQGSRGEVTRCGTKSSGITTYAAGWRGAIRVDVSQNEDGLDSFTVYLEPWQGSGGLQIVLADGLLDSSRPSQTTVFQPDHEVLRRLAKEFG
jgi:hypothetical protein